MDWSGHFALYLGALVGGMVAGEIIYRIVRRNPIGPRWLLLPAALGYVAAYTLVVSGNHWPIPFLIILGLSAALGGFGALHLTQVTLTFGILAFLAVLAALFGIGMLAFTG